MTESFRPIFIVGVGRSGTSLLQTMLNSHSCIAFPPETHYIRTYLGKGLNWEKSKQNILEDKYLRNLELDLNKIIKKSNNPIDLYKMMMNEYLLNKSKKFIGDKDPKNIERIKTIKKHFPNALIIHIYRDPRAVIASRIKAKWSRHRPLWQHILACKAQYNYIKDKEHLFNENFIEIKYETLLNNPQVELIKILKKLELDFEENMLQFFKNADDVVKGEEKSWKSNLYNPVMKENIDKWKDELDQLTIDSIEKSLYPQMKKCDYSYTVKSIIHSKFYELLAKIYCMRNCN